VTKSSVSDDPGYPESAAGNAFQSAVSAFLRFIDVEANPHHVVLGLPYRPKQKYQPPNISRYISPRNGWLVVTTSFNIAKYRCINAGVQRAIQHAFDAGLWHFQIGSDLSLPKEL
jgi:hypothetical protein